jgi:hypothetical protein
MKKPMKPESTEGHIVSRRVQPKGSTVMEFRDGEFVFHDVPTVVTVRKATKQEAREFKRQVREGLGQVTINKRRK